MNSTRTLTAMWIGARLAGSVSRYLGGLFAWRLWFTPWRVGLSERAREREAAWLSGTTPVRIPFGSAELVGFSAGAGPAVLLVHGWGDRASRLGAFIAPLRDAGFRVIGVDMPAHGDSPGRRTNADVMADVVRATAAAVGGVSGVAAHSMGGVATIRALDHGLDVDRVVQLAPALRLEHAMDKFQAMFTLPPRAIEGLRRRINWRFGTSVWDELATDRIAARLDVPVLLFHDRGDVQVDFADGEMLAGAWRTAPLVATEGLGHDRLLRDADVISAAVNFLQQAPAAAAAIGRFG